MYKIINKTNDIPYLIYISLKELGKVMQECAKYDNREYYNVQDKIWYSLMVMQGM